MDRALVARRAVAGSADCSEQPRSRYARLSRGSYRSALSTPVFRLSQIQSFGLPPKKSSVSRWQVSQAARSITSTGRTKCSPEARSVATKGPDRAATSTHRIGPHAEPPLKSISIASPNAGSGIGTVRRAGSSARISSRTYPGPTVVADDAGSFQ